MFDFLLHGGFYGSFGLLFVAFWIWMLVDCGRNEPHVETWLWILILFNVPGSIVYFVVRKLPSMGSGGRPSADLARLIRSLEGQVSQLANAHYLTKLGDAYIEARKFDKAIARYEEALRQEPENAAALLGAGQCHALAGRHEAAIPLLEKSWLKDPSYRLGKCGELLVTSYLEIGDDPRLKEHFDQVRHRIPSAQTTYVECHFLVREGAAAEARPRLVRLIDEIKHLPRFNYRPNKIWLTKAKALLRGI